MNRGRGIHVFDNLGSLYLHLKEYDKDEYFKKVFEEKIFGEDKTIETKNNDLPSYYFYNKIKISYFNNYIYCK